MKDKEDWGVGGKGFLIVAIVLTLLGSWFALDTLASVVGLK